MFSHSKAKAQGLGFFKAKIGNLEVTAISDATGEMPSSLLSGIEPDKVKEVETSIGATGLKFPSFVNVFVVSLPEGLVLVDTGNGPSSNLVKNIMAAGIDLADIKAILLTHFHSDHIGGLVGIDGKPAFPNVTVYADKIEDNYWLGSSTRGEQAKRGVNPYKGNGQYKIVSPGDEVLPGVKVVELYGHTPGHVGYLFEAGDEDFLAWGDIVHIGYVQFKYPEAAMQYDVDKGKAVETRKKILQQSSDNGYAVAGAHLPFPGIGRVSKGSGPGYDYKPVQ
ncbi:MAG: MBL fold metallo-hydrolase [Deltaproteobacteria bacterium]|nr:MBL fold metallo-hydrolase [Deltaproteobacteria bacterium]